MALERADAPSNMLILRNLMLCYQSIMFNYTSMDLRQLQVFHTVMETRSASRAARILGVTQPAVSTLLKRLEARRGIAMFARERNRPQPTPEGVLFMEHVSHALESISMARSAVAKTAELTSELQSIMCISYCIHCA